MADPRKPNAPKNQPDPELGDFSNRLKNLSDRIAAEKSEKAAAEQPSTRFQGAKDYSKGYRLASEFVAGVLVGGLLGYGLDYLLGTLPLFLIVLLLFGFAAGILNVIRVVTEMNAASPAPKGADLGPDVEDDERTEN